MHKVAKEELRFHWSPWQSLPAGTEPRPHPTENDSNSKKTTPQNPTPLINLKA